MPSIGHLSESVFVRGLLTVAAVALSLHFTAAPERKELAARTVSSHYRDTHGINHTIDILVVWKLAKLERELHHLIEVSLEPYDFSVVSNFYQD